MAYTLKLERDRTYQRQHNYKANGLGVDLTGKSVVFHLRKTGGTTDNLLILTCGAAANANGSELTWVNQAQGQMLLTISNTETLAMKTGNGTYSFSLEYNNQKYPMGGGAVLIAEPPIL